MLVLLTNKTGRDPALVGGRQVKRDLSSVGMAAHPPEWEAWEGQTELPRGESGGWRGLGSSELTAEAK